MEIPFWTLQGVIDLANLRHQDLAPEILSATLAKINRFNGRTPLPWSVAQHSVLVAHLVPKNRQPWALLHDAHEAFIGDLTNPAVDFICHCGTGSAVRNAISNAKGKLDRVIGAAYAVAPVALCPELRRADHLALQAEAYAFMGTQPKELSVDSAEFQRALGLVASLVGDWRSASSLWFAHVHHHATLGQMILPKSETPVSMSLPA